MTREEAIKKLKWFKEYNEEDFCGGDRMQDEYGDWYYRITEQDFEAFDMAIKALEQDPTTKNDLGVDCIDRVELLNAMDTWDKFGNVTNGGLIPLRTTTLQDRYVPYVHYEDMVNCVKGMPSVTLQEPILDKLRAEIEMEKLEDSPNFCIKAHNIAVDRVLQILDKYKAETEEI